MKRKNIVNRKVKFLAWQLDKRAKIGIALCKENKLINAQLGVCRTALSETQKKLEKSRKTRDLDRRWYDSIIRDMVNCLNRTTESRNKYQLLFWLLLTSYSVLAVARMVITHFCAE